MGAHRHQADAHRYKRSVERMKAVKYFYLANCPYCRKADDYIRSLCRLNPDYGLIQIERIEESEQPELAAQYDYYYVPTFYVDGVKLHEGVATLEKVKAVLDAALK